MDGLELIDSKIVAELTRVAIPKMAAFDPFYQRLTNAIHIRNLTSHFAME